MRPVIKQLIFAGWAMIVIGAANISAQVAFTAEGNVNPDHRAVRRKKGEVVVTFDKLPTSMSFNLSSFPCLVTENGISYYNGWAETYDPDVGGGSYESLMDLKNRYSRMWIESQNDARIVVRWRGALCNTDEEIAHSEAPGGSPYGPERDPFPGIFQSWLQPPDLLVIKPAELTTYDYDPAQRAYLLDLADELQPDNPTSILVEKDTGITAVFDSIPHYRLNTSITGIGIGSIEKDPDYEGYDTSNWESVSFNDSRGNCTLEDDVLVIESEGGMFGFYNRNGISGHFIAEAEFTRDKNVGLVLFHEKNGNPDPDNYTMLCIDENSAGQTVVYVSDMQNGKKDVLDNTGRYRKDSDEEYDEEDDLLFAPDGYSHTLTGDYYSLPFTGTHKRFRILREDNSDFFHYYYSVSKTVDGREFVDWMELRPSKDWASDGTNYLPGLVALDKGEAEFTSVTAVKKPATDQDDTETGFKAVEREYNWSGFIGDAIVITFDEDFKYHGEDIKFVFWTEMNYIPAWHVNDQLLYTYEFVETWGGGNPGCHEPMSDRLRIWSNVEILEDNDVRKVVKWHYVLCDPDYKVPDNETGEQLPEVDEYWTFYPDGSGTRHIVYTPKLDSEHREAHELGELISIAGSKHHSSDFYASPALTLLNLEGDVVNAHPGPKFDYYSDIDDWNQQILAVHLNDLPDVFCAWSTDDAIPETFSGYKIRYENAWQDTGIQCVHWPVNKRPYTSAFSSGGLWKAEVSHACLLSWGVRDGIEWEDHYKVNDQGRKYREWVSLVGLNDQGDYEGLKKLTGSWLFTGDVQAVSENLEFEKIDYRRKSICFKVTEPGSCEFELGDTDDILINPVFELKNWGTAEPESLNINGLEINVSDYRFEIVNTSDLLIWIKTETDDNIRFEILNKT